MVDASYMEGRRPRPSPLKRYLDQCVIPAAIDAAGAFEAGLERVATTVRLRPSTILMATAAVCLVLPAVLLTRRRLR